MNMQCAFDPAGSGPVRAEQPNLAASHVEVAAEIVATRRCGSAAHSAFARASSRFASFCAAQVLGTT